MDKIRKAQNQKKYDNGQKNQLVGCYGNSKYHERCGNYQHSYQQMDKPFMLEIVHPRLVIQKQIVHAAILFFYTAGYKLSMQFH